MFETLKKIFFTEDVPARKIGEVPVGQADENQDTKNISEPVISFIKTLENEPKRFKLQVIQARDFTEFKSTHCIKKYILTDKFTREVFESDFSDFRVTRYGGYMYGDTYVLKKPPYSWLTEDEWEVLHSAICEYFQNKQTKLAKLRNERAEKFAQKERKRLTEIYCKE